MSRLGKLPIKIPDGTQVKFADGSISVEGSKGKLKEKIHNLIKVEIKDKEIIVSVKNPEEKKEKAFWGLYRSLINNMVIGVNDGFSKKLEIVGVGYRVNIQGNKLTFNVGYSHPVEFLLPEGLSGEVEGNIITVSGPNKQQVGEIASQIRKIRKPEPYKGKGIKYVDEIIIRKEGKTAAKGA